MKKLSFRLFLLAFPLALLSCGKDRTCTCTTTYSDGSPSDTRTTTLVEVSKGQGKAQCVSSTWTDSGVTVNDDCTLN